MRQSQPRSSPESLRKGLVDLLGNFAQELQEGDLRSKVLALVPAFQKLRALGASLIPKADANSARDRIIAYLRKYPRKVIDGDELMVVSGIGEWARRVRELRVQYGWWIYSGMTFKDIADDEEQQPGTDNLRVDLGFDPRRIKPDQYVLMRVEEDREAAHRWNVLNEIRKSPGSVRDKILTYLRKNAGKEVTGEELKYLARDRKEWARRVRELRTESGWPVKTKSSGRPDLAVGVYMLEADRQAYEHDRVIPDLMRVRVLERDQFRCRQCGWDRQKLNADDPRKTLELHHKKHHAKGGENTEANLITLCNVCHDDEHRGKH